MKRREFLKQSALATAALTFPSWKPGGITEAWIDRRGPARKVIIIGAGFSGPTFRDGLRASGSSTA